jgi:hypothetical protein
MAQSRALARHCAAAHGDSQGYPNLTTSANAVSRRR